MIGNSTCHSKLKRLEERVLICPCCGNKDEEDIDPRDQEKTTRGVKRGRKGVIQGRREHCLTILGKRHTLRADVPHGLLRWLTVRPRATLRDTHGGELAAVQK